LEVDLPPEVKEIRCNDRRLRKPALGKAGHWEVALGAAQNLAVGWKQPLIMSGTVPLTTGEGRIGVAMEGKFVSTEAELTLQDPHGLAKQFVLGVPKGATVEARSSEERIAEIKQDGNRSTFFIKLKEASTEPVQVLVKHRQPRPFARLPVGPFTAQ